MQEDTIKEHIAKFNDDIKQRLDDTNFILENNSAAFTLVDEYDLPQWDDSAYGEDNEAEHVDIPKATPEADDIDMDQYDRYIGARVILDDRDNGGGNIATKPIATVVR